MSHKHDRARTFINELVRPAHQRQVVGVHELVNNTFTEQEAGTSRRRGPRPEHLLGIAPHEVAERTCSQDEMCIITIH